MKYCFLLLIFPLFLFSCTYKVYVVRHAEKSAEPPNDPLLTVEGQARSQALKERLQHSKIRRIYSTNTIRTTKTAEPLAQSLGINIETYPARPDTAFIGKIKTNAVDQLIVGHSNTIDDVVNMIMGSKVVPSDLPETIYDNLYIIKMRKNGYRKPLFRNEKYGKTSL
jgi:broad specificity phosphatase PhoE